MDHRRRALVRALGAGSTLALAGCGGGSGGDGGVPAGNPGTPNQPTDPDTPTPPSPEPEPPVPPNVRFLHGVASGDPLSTQVILWTRVTPEEDAVVTVTATVATDPAMTAVVAQYQAVASADGDYCVKVDATGLLPGRWYYYQFEVGQQRSPIGRTRTFPESWKATDRARFAVVSCSNFPNGYFSVYKAVADLGDLDFVLHLGDYIYEYGAGEYGDFPERVPDPPHEIVTREDYRRRHAQYKTDEDLQALHQQFPMIAIWDDHESANDSWHGGAENHDPLTEGVWQQRKSAAREVYFEWMPIRPREPGNTDIIYRRFHFGDLLDLTLLDTRLESRDEPLPAVAGSLDPNRNDPDRRLISEAQMDFLLAGLDNARGHWRFIGQQVMFAQLNILEIPGLTPDMKGQLLAVNMDQWDGYTADRDTILKHIEDNRIDNVVVLTGDIHTSWANELYRNPAVLVGDLFARPLAAEFVAPSVTSPGFPDGLAELASVALPVVNPHIRYTELKTHGFILVDVTRGRAQAEFHYVNSIEAYDLRGQINDRLTKVVAVESGSSRIKEDLPLSRPRTLRTALFHPPVEHNQEEVLS